MGPAFETFLTVIGGIALGVIALAFATRRFWKRVWRALVAWYEHDRREEEEAKAQALLRKQAGAEVDRCTGNPITTASPSDSIQQTEKEEKRT